MSLWRSNDTKKNAVDDDLIQ